MQSDVFISHASEDKETVARPIATALTSRGFKVWYDEYTLKLGDSLNRRINEGLASCRFGVVILSPDFFRREWPKKELDGLVARETATGEKVILPVWHNIDAIQIGKFSPTLADKLGISTLSGLRSVVDKIAELIEDSKKDLSHFGQKLDSSVLEMALKRGGEDVVFERLLPISLRTATLLAPLARFGKGEAIQVAWSPGGSILAIGTSIGIHLYDTVTFEEISFLENRVWSSLFNCHFAFAPDGRWIVGCGYDHLLRFWETDTGHLTRTIEVEYPGDRVSSVAISPDGKLLAAGTYQRVKFVQVDSGQLLKEDNLVIEMEVVEQLTFSSNGRFILAGGDRKGKVWDLQARQILSTIDGDSFALSPDGSLVAFASKDADAQIKVLDIKSNTTLRILEPEDEKNVFTIAFSADGRILTSSGHAGTQLWEVKTGKLLHNLKKFYTRSIAFSPIDNRFVANSYRKVQVWNTDSGNVIHTKRDYTNSVQDVLFSPDGKTIASVSEGGDVDLVDVRTGKLETLDTNDLYSGIAFSPDSRLLATSGDCLLQLWNLETKKVMATFVECEEHFFVPFIYKDSSICFSPDGHLLVRRKEVWNVANGQIVGQLVGPCRDIYAVAFSRDGAQLATVSKDGEIALWEMNSFTLRHALPKKYNLVYALSFAADGSAIIVVNQGKIEWWSCATGELFQEQSINVHGAACMSQDQVLLVEGDVYHNAVLLDMMTGQHLCSLEGHSSKITCCTFGPTGRLLATGSQDGTIRLWGAIGR